MVDLYREIYEEKLPTATVRQFVGAWLKAQRPTVAPSTIGAYEINLKRLLEFLGSLADQDLNLVTKERLLQFRATLETQLSPSTVNAVLRRTRMIFKAAKRDGYILENPAEFVGGIRDRSKARRRPFTVQEIRRLLELADEEWKSLILCGLYTGQRLSDLAELTWDNVDLVNNEIRMVVKKTGKRMTLPMAAPLRRHLEVFPKVTPQALRCILTLLAASAGMVTRQCFQTNLGGC